MPTTAPPAPAGGAMRAVTAPDGTEHVVRIEWIGNALRRAPGQLRRRVRTMARWADEDGEEVALFGLDLVLELTFVALFVLAVVAVLFVLPLAWGLLEVVVIVLLGALVWTTRVLFRRPWAIVQLGPTGLEEDRWHVVGWRAAHRRMVEAAAAIQATGTARPARPVAGQD